MSEKRQRGAKADPAADEAVYQAITRAIMDGRLKAGTKLVEQTLAEAFGVSRERIRKVLHRLGAERRIEIVPNRGSRVPSPSPQEIRAVYEAHRVLEAGVLVQLAHILTDDILARLDAHLLEEKAAAARGDRAASVRLSGAFHMHLVDALENEELSRFLRDLLSRSSVMVSVYEPAADSACAVDEHGAIVEALRARDVAQAIHLSRHHFQHVEQRLRLDRPQGPAPDLRALFSPEALAD
ncbi:GntR family transcriptional regulator [Azorhizobium oxalatiphilum]|uniref:GntR family transcriptional regulator n=1 Tax=Azorhizobium oxalatiphilum TaxID=980631 RepID=A0A917FHE7_9HYPH|nr:GntR family transcriptional regulator [Azorhizobium oxalatiphilum]GGF80957.1 GntR family transcriptional regulator [Azorhizobium oxalatiphilum]